MCPASSYSTGFNEPISILAIMALMAIWPGDILTFCSEKPSHFLTLFPLVQNKLDWNKITEGKFRSSLVIPKKYVAVGNRYLCSDESINGSNNSKVKTSKTRSQIRLPRGSPHNFIT